MANTTILFANWPQGVPDIQKDFKTVKLEIPKPKEGEVLVRTLFLSVDPYMRGRMRNVKSYFETFKIGHPLDGGGVGVVEDSKHPDWKSGDVVSGMLKWQEYNLLTKEVLPTFHKVPNTGAPLSYALGVLGMPGMTAYFGLLDICDPKKGETVVVSGAAGAVGVLVGQIAKIIGCHVVGIVGSDEKAELLKKEFGFDVVINYKTCKNMEAAIRAAAPKGVDCYFDNVGGTISDAVDLNLNTDARVSLCGAIADYNATSAPVGPRDNWILITRQVKKQGFIVSRWLDRWPQGIRQMATWLAEGKIKYVETYRHGLENTPKAFVEMLAGENVGKMVVQISKL